jgi:hypothetical protein
MRKGMKEEKETKTKKKQGKKNRTEIPIFAGLWYPANNICIS